MELRRTDRASLIKKESLNKNQYFISIIKQGYNAGLISVKTAEIIETGISSIIREMILKYTSGDSSSVKDETAAAILSSIYYCIDAYAASLEIPGDIILQLNEKSMKDIYELGIEAINTCIKESNMLYKEIYNNKLDIPMQTYNDTINEALPSFFANYNVEFGAHEVASAMDYPLAFDDMSTRGIFYIKQYLENLKTETEFCSCFSENNIMKTLSVYGHKFRFDYINAPINLFEILLDQSLFSVLSGSDEVGLPITSLQFGPIFKRFSTMQEADIHINIENAFSKITDIYSVNNSVLKDYIIRYEKLFVKRYITALDNGNLANMVLIEGENPQDGKIIFDDGDRMDDEQFTKLIDLVEVCENITEKIELISSQVHSLEDYMDLLSSDCLYDDEYIDVFGALSDTELAVIGGTILSEELRNGPLNISSKILLGFKKNAEQDWQKYYVDFILNLDGDRQKIIEGMINKFSFNTDVVF